MPKIWLLKLFGTGQITLPKQWRVRESAQNYIAEETAAGLLIRPFVQQKRDEKELDITFDEIFKHPEIIKKANKISTYLNGHDL